MLGVGRRAAPVFGNPTAGALTSPDQRRLACGLVLWYPAAAALDASGRRVGPGIEPDHAGRREAAIAPELFGTEVAMRPPLPCQKRLGLGSATTA